MLLTSPSVLSRIGLISKLKRRVLGEESVDLYLISMQLDENGHWPFGKYGLGDHAATVLHETRACGR